MATWTRSSGVMPAPGEYARVIRPVVGDVVRVGCSCGHVFGVTASQLPGGEGVLTCPKCGTQDQSAVLESWDEPATPVT